MLNNYFHKYIDILFLDLIYLFHCGVENAECLLMDILLGRFIKYAR